jgi:hypothetical protein
MGRINELIAYLRRIRPNIDWQQAFQTDSSEQAQTSSRMPVSQQHVPTKLSGIQFKRLVEALNSAFTSYIDLSMLVRFELDVNLEVTISSSDNLREVAYRIVNWAESQAKIEELIAGARRQNPGNPELLAIAQEILGPDA